MDLQQLSQYINKLPFIKGKARQIPTGPSLTIGCDFGSSKILVMEMKKSEEGVSVERFHRIPRDKSSESASKALAECFETGGYSSRKVRISVKGQSVIVRFIRFPKMNIEEVRSAITYEAENYIPFKVNEVIMDFHILEDNLETATGKEMNLLLVAVKKDEIYPMIKNIQDAGLEIECIDIDVLASINALEHFYPEDVKKSVAFLDIGKEISSVSVLREGKPRFIRDTSYGDIDITKRLRRKLGLSEKEAIDILEMEKSPGVEAIAVLKEGYEALVSDLKVTLDYYLEQVAFAQPVEKLFMGGGGGDPKIITESLSKHLGIPVLGMDVLNRIQLSEQVDRTLIEKNQGQLAVVLGLCLRP